MDPVTLTPLDLFLLGAGMTAGVGLIFIWRENTWSRRVESLRADFGKELRRRDDEILRLSTQLNTILEMVPDERRNLIGRARERERQAGTVYNVGGDANFGGDAVGGEKLG